MFTLLVRTFHQQTIRMNKYNDMMTFYSLVGRLKFPTMMQYGGSGDHITALTYTKKTKRTGWVRRGVEDPETISGHMYRMSIMAMTMCEENLNKDHCVKMCLVHDMAECIVGDYTPSDNISKEQKYKEETNAMKQLGELLPTRSAEEIKSLFQEYEDQKTPESIFVKDLDRLDMILQAFEYEKESGRPGWLQEFFDSTEGVFVTEPVKDFVCALREERAKEKS